MKFMFSFAIYSCGESPLSLTCTQCLSPMGSGGNDFCVICQAEVATDKLQEPGWEHIQGGKMVLGSQAGGGTALS